MNPYEHEKCCLAAAGIGLAFTLVLLLSGCAALETKAVAVASGVDAVNIRVDRQCIDRTVPDIIWVARSIRSAPPPVMDNGKTAQPTYSKSRRNSFFGSLFGVDNTTETIAYTGVPGETADETAKRCKALPV